MPVIFFCALGWSAAGLAIAALFARHGHNFFLLALLGIAYGPLLPVIYKLGMAGQASSIARRQRGSVIDDRGWLKVLVGIDGSEASVASAGRVVDALGPAVREATVASVVDHEIGNAPDHFAADDTRWAFLQRAVGTFGLANAELVLLSGQADKALSEHAVGGDFDLIVVAHRGHRALSGIRGSTAGRLAANNAVPVLIGPPA